MCHRFGSNIMTTTALESPSASSMVRLSGPLVELVTADNATIKDISSDLPERIEIIFIHLLNFLLKVTLVTLTSINKIGNIMED